MKPSCTLPLNATPSVVAQIVNLPQLGMPALKALWQLLEYSKTNQPLVMRNQQRIQQLIALESPPPKRAASQALLPGTLLTRHYQGVDHQVLVQAADCFIYQERHYSNLSQLAREITGTRWSGPLFFGLKERVKSSTAHPSRRSK